MEQPKDFFEEVFDEIIRESIAELKWYQKITVYFISHIYLTIASSLILGYLAGSRFGVFW
jgi:hypothetical protein